MAANPERPLTRLRYSGKQLVSVTLIVAGVIMIFGAGLVVLSQGFFWLKNGAWYPISIGYAWFHLIGNWPIPDIRWIGLLKIVLWLLDCAFSLFLWVVAILLIGIGAGMERN